jgi:hypothetical protein
LGNSSEQKQRGGCGQGSDFSFHEFYFLDISFEVFSVCAPAISAFKFSEIGPEVGLGFQLADDSLRLGPQHDRYCGQFHACNFKENPAPVKYGLVTVWLQALPPNCE